MDWRRRGAALVHSPPWPQVLPAGCHHPFIRVLFVKQAMVGVAADSRANGPPGRRARLWIWIGWSLAPGRLFTYHERGWGVWGAGRPHIRRNEGRCDPRTWYVLRLRQRRMLLSSDRITAHKSRWCLVFWFCAFLQHWQVVLCESVKSWMVSVWMKRTYEYHFVRRTPI